MSEENKIMQNFRKRDIFVARFITFIVLVGIVVYAISSISEESKANNDTQNTPDDFVYNRAHNIASTTADILLKQISDETKFNVDTKATDNYFGRKATYTVEDNFFENDSLIEIKVTAKYNDVTTVITTGINRETKRKEKISVKYLYD